MATPNPTTPQPERNIREILRELSPAISKWFGKLFDLEKGLDRENTIVEIKTNKRIEGANAWLLMCSILIASLGLSLNSPAVIIGAMLVSPLMSPILGIGLGVAINDKDTLFISLRHFGIAMFIAVFTSTLYFYILNGDMTDEIRGRTSPTLLDGMVAIFGGVAGIISVTRKGTSNAIPGVAIATALMPPLCVTGFGLARLIRLYLFPPEVSELEYQELVSLALNTAGGSFYLFFLNSFFIAFMSYIIIRLLKFPLRAHVNEREARRNRMITILVSGLIIILPTRILINLSQYNHDQREAEAFVKRHFPNSCFEHELTHTSTDTNQLVLRLLGRSLSRDSIAHYDSLLNQNYALNKPARIYAMQAELSMAEVRSLMDRQEKSVLSVIDSTREFNVQTIEENTRLREELGKITSDSALVAKTFLLVDHVYKNVTSIRFDREPIEALNGQVQKAPPTFYVRWEGRFSGPEQEDLRGFLKKSTDLDTFRIVRVSNE